MDQPDAALVRAKQQEQIQLLLDIRALLARIVEELVERRKLDERRETRMPSGGQFP